MAYAEKLKDPKWQKRRLEILSRDRFCCQSCGNNLMELHIHHKSYSHQTDPLDYPDENLVTYCKICHQIAEDLKFLGGVEIISASIKKDDGFDMMTVIIKGESDVLVSFYSVTHRPIHVLTLKQKTVNDLFNILKSASLLYAKPSTTRLDRIRSDK